MLEATCKHVKKKTLAQVCKRTIVATCTVCVVEAGRLRYASAQHPAAWHDDTSENALKEYQYRADEGSKNKKTDSDEVGLFGDSRLR